MHGRLRLRLRLGHREGRHVRHLDARARTTLGARCARFAGSLVASARAIRWYRRRNGRRVRSRLLPDGGRERLLRCHRHGAPLRSVGAFAAFTRFTTRHRIDGTELTVRPIRADDLPLEADFVRHLSSESRYERFMVTVGELSARKLEYLTDVDQLRHVALVATTAQDGRETIVGVVRYIVDPAGTGCEFAVAIDDAWHGTGLAGILMQALIDVARTRGLRTMEGFVLAANAPMLRFARQLGFRVRRDPEDRDTVHVERSL